MCFQSMTSVMICFGITTLALGAVAVVESYRSLSSIINKPHGIKRAPGYEDKE